MPLLVFFARNTRISRSRSWEWRITWPEGREPLERLLRLEVTKGCYSKDNSQPFRLLIKFICMNEKKNKALLESSFHCQSKSSSQAVLTKPLNDCCPRIWMFVSLESLLNTNCEIFLYTRYVWIEPTSYWWRSLRLSARQHCRSKRRYNIYIYI